MKYLLPLLLLGSPALAEFSMTEGSFFMAQSDYDHTTDSFTGAPPAGEEEACFQITSVAEDKSSFGVVLVSGYYKPHWSNEVYPVGSTDRWIDFPDSGWRDNHPNGDWEQFVARLLKTVPSCPAPSSKP